jgi:site-specific DNA recombinase
VDSPKAIREWAGPRRAGRLTALGGPGDGQQAVPGVLRAAFAGRTSTYDQQDPTLSIPRQLRASQAVLPADAVIVAHFYDIESGRKELADRGHGRAHEQFRILVPRDGGIADLLAEAERPDRRFDIVICESIDRIARRTYIATEIEHRLEMAGVRLVAADEPVILNGGRRAKTATQVLTRRVKQGVAEWYVLEILEKSWGGFEMHTEAGFNIGMPCYGYRALRVPHPVPAKRAKGVKKTRLEPHPDQAPVVRKMFAWRVEEQLAYQVIADRLNLDLALNPPPVPVTPERSVGRWTYSNVRDVLTNPKHTGHMVWNRRARKGAGKNKVNPVTEWVWSPQPVHEALVDLETFVLAQEVAGHRERSRTAPGLNPGPEANRVYPLRSFIFCDLCGRRMFGNTRRETISYICNPKKAYLPPGHPVTLRVREDHLLSGLARFLADDVFGPYRHSLLDASHTAVAREAKEEYAGKIKALQKAITDASTKSSRLIRTLEITDDLDPDFIRDINQRRAELHALRDELEGQLAAAQQQGQDIHDPALLDQLPVTDVDLEDMPDEVSRRLFEALRLEIRYDPAARVARCSITLIGETIDAVSRITEETAVRGPNRDAIRNTHKTTDMSDGLCGAPSKIRTCAPGSGGRAHSRGSMWILTPCPGSIRPPSASAARSRPTTTAARPPGTTRPSA